jgi:pimeloyl-ACP methyl ester carboxylesterase
MIKEFLMGKVISKDGTAITFDKSGEGSPLILVSGAFTVRLQPTLVQLAALLAPHFTIFNYDRRGRGESGDTPPYAVEREVEDLAALIKEAGGWACVWGWSSGAALALEAAARGIAITRLALYEAPYIVDDSRPPLPQDYMTQITEMIASGRRGDAVEYFMTRAAEAPAEWVAQMRNTPMWEALEAVAHTLIYDVTIMGGNNALPTERVASVTVPTLVIDGGASPAWMRHAAQAVADILPDAQRRTLEGQTHDVAPDALAPVLEEFFAGRLTTR